MKEKPIRVQRSRKKGSITPPNTVYVGRPSKWGNPYTLSGYLIEGESDPKKVKRIQRELAVRDFDAALYMASPPDPIPGWLGFTTEDVKRELRGKNLSCWCPLDEPCHADVLLRIANELPIDP